MTTIKKGTNWQGSYSRFSYDKSLRYFGILKEQGVPVLDDEFNLNQGAALDAITDVVSDLIGSGSANNGAKIVGSGADNNFTISAGNIYVAGLRLYIPASLTYTTQEIAPPALTTPGGARTDNVYLEAWLDEAGPGEDGSMVDPTLGVETSQRLKLRYRVGVVEGGPAPTTFVAADTITHHVIPLASIARTATAAIDPGMVTDLRGDPSIAGQIASHNNSGSAHAAIIAAAIAAHNADVAAHDGLADATFAPLSGGFVFPGGLHVRWGRTTAQLDQNSAPQYFDFSFSTPFPDECVFASAMALGNGSDQSVAGIVINGVVSMSETGLRVQTNEHFAIAQAYRLMYFAVGY